jgi:hypothetical protein
VQEYLGLDDLRVTIAIDGWAGRGGAGRDDARALDPVLRDLAGRFASRRLFKTIDLGDDPTVIERAAPHVEDVARRHFGDAARSYYQIDTTRQIGYAGGPGEELFVVGHPRHGTVSLGRLLEELPLGRPLSTVRLVCAPELVAELRPIARSALGKR